MSRACARFLLPSLLAAALAAGGCSSPKKKLAQQEKALLEQNSRTTESRRMRALDYGDAASMRGAEIIVVDPTKTFDPTRSGVGTVRAVSTGGVRTKEFNYDQKARPGSFLTRAFSSSKSNLAAEKQYATHEADTRGKYKIPGAVTDATKTSVTKDLPDGEKVAATQGARDGTRPYLGPETKHFATSVDPKTLADWRSGAGETINYHSTYVERVSNLKQLSIEDVRELLNKNK